MTAPPPGDGRDDDEREALSTAQALEDSLDKLTAAMTSIIKWKQRVFQAAVATVVIAALAIGLSWWSNHAAAQRIHAAQLNSCETIGNTFRVSSDQVWHKFVAIATAGKPQTAGQQEIIRKLFAYVDGVFRPVDCRKLYP